MSLGEDGVGSCLGVAQMMFCAGDQPPMLGRDSLAGDRSSCEQLKEYCNLIRKAIYTLIGKYKAGCS